MKETDEMNIISSKKIAYCIKNLIYFNVLNWFWRIEDLLEEKNLWDSINEVISNWNTQESDEKNENVKPKSLSKAVAAKTADSEWKQKNSKTKTIISELISEEDVNMIRIWELKYISNIWLYLKFEYTRISCEMLTVTMRSFTCWKKNSDHTMKKTAQEIEAIADQMQQLNGFILDFFLVKHQFLSGLSNEYESACQILESQDAKMREIITRLMKIELHMKNARNDDLTEMTHCVKKKKKIWCFNCDKKGHFAKNCDKESSEMSSKNKKEAKKSWGKKIRERISLALESNSEYV